MWLHNAAVHAPQSRGPLVLLVTSTLWLKGQSTTSKARFLRQRFGGMDRPSNIPELAETAQVSASRAAAAVQRDNHPKKRRVLTIRGCPFAGKVSSTSEALGKMVVEALQADDVYPKFAHDEWAVQIKLNSTGDILLRPVKTVVEAAPAVVPASPSPVQMTWEDERLGLSMTPPLSPIGDKTPFPSEEAHTVAAGAQVGGSSEASGTCPAGDGASPLPPTPPDAQDWSPDSKFLLKVSLK